MQNKHYFFLLIVLLFAACAPRLSYRLDNHDMITVETSAGMDSSINNIIQPYRDSIQGVMGEVIGYSPQSLIGKKPESGLSNFVADLVWEAGKKFLRSQNIEGESFCIINIRGLRSTMPRGDVTTRDIFEIMPFENSMVAVEMDAQNLKLLFDHIAYSNGDGLAGASFTLKGNIAENIRVNNQPIQPDKKYWVITSDYLADGGDGYAVFKNSERHLVSYEKVRELIIEHIQHLTRQGLSIEPDLSTRITIE